MNFRFPGRGQRILLRRGSLGSPGESEAVQCLWTSGPLLRDPDRTLQHLRKGRIAKGGMLREPLAAPPCHRASRSLHLPEPSGQDAPLLLEERSLRIVAAGRLEVFRCHWPLERKSPRSCVTSSLHGALIVRLSEGRTTKGEWAWAHVGAKPLRVECF